MRATNETRKPTATPNGKTAGKTAKKNTRRIWHTVTRNGVTCLVAPNGTRYRGTAQEVRDAALMPYKRDALAQSIVFARYIAAQFDYTPEQRREYVREKRREAIRTWHLETHLGNSIRISPELYLQLTAGARLVMGDGEKLEDYFRQLFESELEALLDVAQSETGKREIPMTRHERAAFARLSAGRVA